MDKKKYAVEDKVEVFCSSCDTEQKPLGFNVTKKDE